MTRAKKYKNHVVAQKRTTVDQRLLKEPREYDVYKY